MMQSAPWRSSAIQGIKTRHLSCSSFGEWHHATAAGVESCVDANISVCERVYTETTSHCGVHEACSLFAQLLKKSRAVEPVPSCCATANQASMISAPAVASVWRLVAGNG